MKKGLVFGKFMPLHTGHLSLINFSLTHCDHLDIILCYTSEEPIAGTIRKQWLDQTFEKNPEIIIHSFQYDDKHLPNSSVSSRHVSGLWAETFKVLVPDVDIVFTSEDYGDYLAEYMGIEHLCFDKNRVTIAVSATEIRDNPLLNWNYIAEKAKPWFVRKIALIGTESTGKSVLTQRLARHFETSFVPEIARDIIEKTKECTPDDLYKIAAAHARAIVSKLPMVNKLLFVDTDLVITQSYSQFLFRKTLIVEPWIEEVNKFDLYLFLEPDCAYIQDGTRLSLAERNLLSEHHRMFFENAGITLVSINGNWEERYKKAISVIINIFFNKKTATNK